MKTQGQTAPRRVTRLGQFKPDAIGRHKALADAGPGLWRP